MKKTNSSMYTFFIFGAAALLIEWMIFSFGYASSRGTSFGLKNIVIGLTIPFAFVSWGLFIRFPSKIALAISAILSLGAVCLFVWFVIALAIN